MNSPPPTMLDTKTSCMQPSASESETEPECMERPEPLFTCSKVTSSRCSRNLDGIFWWDTITIKNSIGISINEHMIMLSSYFCLTMSKHLSMLALVPSMLQTLISPWGAEACCRLFLPRLPFAPFFGFNPSVSWEQNMKEISWLLRLTERFTPSKQCCTDIPPSTSWCKCHQDQSASLQTS